MRNGRHSYKRQIREWSSAVRPLIEDSQEEEWLPEVKRALHMLYRQRGERRN